MALALPLGLSLPVAIPAAVAAASYVDARYGFSYDWPLVSSILRSVLQSRRAERRGRLNLFYALEERALDRRLKDHPFILIAGKQWTYAEALDASLRYARWLKDGLGVRRGQVVALDFVNCEQVVWLSFALWSLGARMAFINYNLKGKPLVHCVRVSTANLVVADPRLADDFDEGVRAELAQDGVAVEVLGAEVERGVLRGEPWREPDEARADAKLVDMCGLIFTSGTTGLPKPAVISWNKVVLAGKFCSLYLGVREDDIVYTCMPLYHSSAFILGLIVTLQAGATVAIGEKFSTRTFWEDVRASSATIIQYVGETCRYLIAAPPSALDRTHRVRMAYGNGLRPDVWNPFKTRFAIPAIYEFYGATEGPALLWNRSRNDFAMGAVGRMGAISRLANRLRSATVLLSADGQTPHRDPRTGFCTRIPQGANAPGELIYKLDPADIRASFQGYLDNPAATSSKVLRGVFAAGDAWYRTGDAVRADAEGRVFFVDRVGDTFRWKSENVSTAEVAAAVGGFPAVAEAAVYGVLVPRHDGRAGCAAVVPRDPAAHAPTPDPAFLRGLAAHARAQLPRYAVPLFLRVTPALERTGTNKHVKHALQREGADPAKAAESGDRMFWLRGGEYVPFEQADWRRVEAGEVKL